MKPLKGRKAQDISLPEYKGREHRGKVIPTVQFASEVRRNGKLIRRNGVPVKEEET